MERHLETSKRPAPSGVAATREGHRRTLVGAVGAGSCSVAANAARAGSCSVAANAARAGSRRLGAAVLLALSCVLLVAPTHVCASEESAPGWSHTSPEALLVHGIGRFEGGAMRDGLEDLERAVALRPDWDLARRALAYALVRAGRFGRAKEELVALVGASVAEGLESGEITGVDVADFVEAEDVLGLAIVRAETGAHREADRLYRSYADLVGPSTPEAARAFSRLADMYRASGAEWGSAEVELGRALALDPDVESGSTLPRFPDPRDHEELEPYTRALELAPGRDAPPDGYDSLPRLAGLGVAASKGPRSSGPLTRDIEVEFLVGEDGTIAEIALPEGVEEGSPQAAEVRAALAGRTFEPAMSFGLPIGAWIVMEVEIPLAAAAPDTTRSPEQGAAEPEEPGAAEPAGTEPSATEQGRETPDEGETDR